MENTEKKRLDFAVHFGWSKEEVKVGQDWLKDSGPKLLLTPDYYLSDAVKEISELPVPEMLKIVTAFALGKGYARSTDILKRIAKELEE